VYVNAAIGKVAFQALVTDSSKGHATLLTCADAILVESNPRMSMLKMILKSTPGLTPFVYVWEFLHALYHATQVVSVSFGAIYEKLSGIWMTGYE